MPLVEYTELLPVGYILRDYNFQSRIKLNSEQVRFSGCHRTLSAISLRGIMQDCVQHMLRATLRTAKSAYNTVCNARF